MTEESNENTGWDSAAPDTTSGATMQKMMEQAGLDGSDGLPGATLPPGQSGGTRMGPKRGDEGENVSR